MAEGTEDVQAHWTRRGVLARIDAALTELGHDPQNLSPEILATLERKERDLVEETRGHAPSHQLSLFDSHERDVIDALRILQPEAMTPIQALNELQRLKEKLEK